MLNINPKFGKFSYIRKSYDKINENEDICRNFLKYINFDKFGNDDKNFAALLINGHCDSRICEQLQEKLVSEFQSKYFVNNIVSNDIQKYIESIISQFEKKFFNKMSVLSKKRKAMFQCMLKSHNKAENTKLLKELDDTEKQLNSGATIAIVIVVKGNIYIFNIGDNQIILVSKDDDYNDEYNQKFILLTDEQSFHNEEEIQRIKEDCGLDPDAFRWLLSLSTERCHSRCIGDYEIKYNFDKFQNLGKAKTSPLISTPQPSKCILLEENFSYFILISSGLYYLVRELIYDKDKIPGEITRKIFEIKSLQSHLSLDELCKIVIESFVSEHKKCHDQYKSLTGDNCTLWEYSHHDDLSMFLIELNVSQNVEHLLLDVVDGFSFVDSVGINVSSSLSSIDGKDFSNPMKDQFSSLKSSINSCHNTVPAYVDFNDWTKALNKLSKEDLAFIDSIIDSPEACDRVISEESECQLVSRSATLEDSTDIANSLMSPLRIFECKDV